MKNGLFKDANGDKYWHLNDKLHREDGPAIEYANGNKHWYLNGRLHREDGPAVERANGDKHWCLNGHVRSFNAWLEENTYLSDEEKVMIVLNYR